MQVITKRKRITKKKIADSCRVKNKNKTLNTLVSPEVHGFDFG